MLRYRRRYWAIAMGLSAIAGFVDAAAFIQLGGFFVSFMSGNSTRFAVSLAEAAPAAALTASLIGVFTLGVMLGAMIGKSDDRCDGAGSLRVLLMVAALLVTAAGLGTLGAAPYAIALMALAMGAENCIFQRDGEVAIGLTYMTGTLVKFGQRFAAALTGGPRLDWLPYLLLWLGMIGGAIAGAFAQTALGLPCIWLPAVAAALLALTMRAAQRAERRA